LPRLASITADCNDAGLSRLEASVSGLAGSLRSLSTTAFIPQRQLTFLGRLTSLASLRMCSTGLPPWLSQLSALTRLQNEGIIDWPYDVPVLACLRGLRELEVERWVGHGGGGRMGGGSSGGSGSGGTALALGVTQLVCRHVQLQHLPSLAATTPGAARVAVTVAGDDAALAPLPPGAVTGAWPQVGDLEIACFGCYMSQILDLGLAEVLHGGGLRRLCLVGAPNAAQLALLLSAPALEDLTLTLPRGGDLEALLAPSLAAPGGGRALQTLTTVNSSAALQRLTAEGLLALGRALPALQTLVVGEIAATKCQELMRDLAAIGGGGGGGDGGGGQAVTEQPDTDTDDGPSSRDLLPAARAALARLAAK